MNLIEAYRKQVINHIFTLKSFSKVFENWRPLIVEIIGKNPDATKIINIGNSLRDIFRSTSSETRSQSELASGGKAWECLVCWYLNLCLIGSRSIIILPSKKFRPNSIADAMSVNYGPFSSNSESDLIGITLPNNYEINIDEDLFKSFFSICKLEIEKLDVVNIQCKTNWADNAQIPMLWDMIYKSTEFRDSNLSIGKNSRHISHLNSFKYSFVTVPSQQNIEKFKHDSTPVNRVRNLSGFHYWGAATKEGVAKNLQNIFVDLFLSGCNSKSIHNDLNNAISLGSGIDYSYFNILDFDTLDPK